MGDWRLLGSVGGERLRRERLAAHHAAQVFWAMGNALGERQPDDSHTSFAWDGRKDRFLGGDAPSGVRAALTPRDGTVHLLAARGESLGAVTVAGKTLREVLDSLGEMLAGADVSFRPIQAPDYDLPAHPEPEGRFAAPDGAAAAEVCAWFQDAHLIAESTRAATTGAAPVRIWPHHFDIATLVSLDSERSINVGLSPGDDKIPVPYFYVTPWPRPESGPPPPPGAGRWHTEGWFGAVLEADRVTELSAADAQRERVQEFVGAAMASARGLLAGKDEGQ